MIRITQAHTHSFAHKHTHTLKHAHKQKRFMLSNLRRTIVIDNRFKEGESLALSLCSNQLLLLQGLKMRHIAICLTNLVNITNHRNARLKITSLTKYSKPSVFGVQCK